MSNTYCEYDPWTTTYTELAISIPLFIILQILLVGYTLYYECLSFKKHKHVTRTKLSVRISFILLQLCGLYWTLIDLFRFLIDPFFQFIQKNEFSCGLVAYSPKAIVIIYFTVYLHQILLRLELSFRGSYLAMKKTTIIILKCFVFIPGILIPITFFSFTQPYCIWKWNPNDISVDNSFAFCDVLNDGIANIIIGLGILWVVVSNIIYGIIFAMKLNKVLKTNKNINHKTSFTLKSLIIKNGILTTTAIISTLFNWILWLLISSYGIGTFLLYFDVWFNCLSIALMFKYNENYYKIICKICIKCCLMKCDKSYDQNDKMLVNKRKQKMQMYLQQVNLSQIFSTSKERDQSVQTESKFSSASTSNADININVPVSPKPVKSISDMMVDADNNTHVDHFELDLELTEQIT